MDIQPANIAQMRQARDGSWITLEPEWGTVARDLKDLDETLRLRVSEATGAFVVFQRLPDGRDHLVTTAMECDQRLVDRVREVKHASYDFLAERNRLAAEGKADERYARSQRTREKAEELLFAMQAGSGVQNTVFLGDELRGRRRRKGLK